MNPKMKTVFLVCLSISTMAWVFTGCDKKAEKEGEGGEDKGAKSSIQDLGKTGLKAEIPSGAKVGKAIVGEGVMVQAPGLVVTVEKAGASRPKTVEEAKKEAEMYTPKSIETEELSDGWTFSFENKGSMGTNYFVWVRRKIGDVDYWCSTTGSKPEQKKNTLSLCKSLKK